MKNLILLILIISLSIISYSIQFDSSISEINIQNIFYENKEMEIENLHSHQNEYYYHLIIDKNLNLPNYLLLTMNIEEIGIVTKFSIFFYQEDSTFTKIKHISKTAQSLSLCPKMWLNKEQIKNGFYFKIKDDTQKFIFKVKIIPKDYCELNLDIGNSLYDYYITQENKNIDFIIKGEKEDNYLNNSTIIIWINSNKEIKVYLNNTDYIKHSKYNTFIIKPKKYEEYILNIKGTIGDFINVGFMYIKTENKYNVVQNLFKTNIGYIYKGFLKKNILEQICFDEDDIITYNFIDNINIKININKYYYQFYRFQCINLPENYDELIFDAHYIWYFGYPLCENSPSYYSLLAGVNYYQNIPEKITLGYLPIDINKDSNFNFLTYNIITYMSKDNIFKVYISECNDYPSCSIKKIDLKNSIELKPYFNSYTYILKKEDIKKYLNPFNNTKKILIIDCIKGNNNFCEFNINIYTDKLKVIQKLHKYYFFQYKFINKKNNDNLLIIPEVLGDIDFHDTFYGYIYPFISIELLSGDIIIETDKEVNINYENKYIFKLNSSDEALNIKIEAKKNSIYSIKYYYTIKEDNNNYYAPLGENYLFNIEKEIYSVLYFYDFGKSSKNIFTRIYPINCGNDSLFIYDLPEYQLPNSNKSLYQFIYFDSIKNSIKNLNKVNSCMIYGSSYEEGNDIILYDNSPQIFCFNQDQYINELNYVYYLGDINDDIYINISLLNKGNYNINLFINDIQYEKYFNVTSNKIIRIEHINFENMNIKYQPIKISFKIKVNNNIENIIIKININSNSKLKEKNNNIKNKSIKDNVNAINNKKSYYILIIILALVSGLFIIFIFMKKRIYSFGKRRVYPNIEMKEIDNKFIE